MLALLTHHPGGMNATAIVAILIGALVPMLALVVIFALSNKSAARGDDTAPLDLSLDDNDAPSR